MRDGRLIASTFSAFALVGSLSLTQCGTSEDATRADAGPTDATTDASDGTGRVDAAVDAVGTHPVVACDASEIIQTLGACIDEGGAPRSCLAQVRTPGAPTCDADGDGLDDALEAAMLRSYAPVFAFNEGDGGHTAGDSEPNFPDNVKHYVENASLYWRVDGDESTRRLVDAKPTLDGLRSAQLTVDGTERHADDPSLGQGSNFWLCLDTPGGNYPPDALVSNLASSVNLAGGIDVLSVAHPSGDDPTGRYAMLGYALFYAYNKFTLDDHEGDLEGGAVFVDLDTGDVSAVYTDRHATADSFKLVPLEGPGALSPKDPATSAPQYNICSNTSDGEAAGVRFWDYAGARHHPVFYPAAGGHASYAYPGATKIQGVKCLEATIVRDVHNGLGPKLVPHENAYYADWGSTKTPVVHGVNIVNLGERAHLFAQWSAFAGQWGCTLESIPKSYPIPWDNDRLCRHWLTNTWGTAPPFAVPAPTSCGS